MADTINLLEDAFEKQATSERRFGERRPAPTLAVYYWNGGTPTPHRIRDVSLSGVYLVTREELFPGAMILLTMQREDLDETSPDQWIAVHALVVRRDRDGVALSFAFPKSRTSRIWKVDLANGATRIEVACFLSKLFEDENRRAQQMPSSPDIGPEILKSTVVCEEPRCSRVFRNIGTSKVCVCNLNRERLVSLNMSVIDTVRTPLRKLVDDLSEIPESGLWLAPFRGIPCGRGVSRFDVVFLDDNHRIEDCVEGFAVAESGSFHGRHASAVIVPPGTIFASQIQVGDRLRICSPDSRANDLSDSPWSSSAKQAEKIVAKQFHCLRNGSPTLPRAVTARDGKALHLANEDGRASTLDWGKASVKTRLLRWFFPGIEPPDRRRAERIPVERFVAYYCNGAPPRPYPLGDVSSTGFFLITEERWLPGTRILVTLQKDTCEGHDCADWTRVESRVVRWGEDGVGFEIVKAKDAQILLANDFERRAFEEFLAEVKAASKLSRALSPHE